MGDSANVNEKKTKKTGFFKGLRKEFKKITWPSRNDIVKQTTATVVISIAVGLLIALLDTIIQYGVDFLITF